MISTRSKNIFDREKISTTFVLRDTKNASRRKKLRSAEMASRADARDRAIGAKIRAQRVRSSTREISFSFRAHSDDFFCALVLFTK
jgi:hypothetical protein